MMTTTSSQPNLPSANLQPNSESNPTLEQQSSSDQQAATPIRFRALDGYPLSGYHYAAASSSLSAQSRACVLIASATAVPQQFYRRFATFLTTQGYDVFTFDYRGIGESAPDSLRHFDMHYLDWGQLDMAGVTKAIKASNPTQPLILLGHSYGGQALGLMPNHELIDLYYTFGAGVGWAGYMPTKERLKVNLFWHLIFPFLSQRYGYLPAKLGFGVDLPLQVYKQWKTWAQSPEYYFADPTLSEQLIQQFAKVTTPIIACTATDDEWALPISRDAFVKYYSHAPQVRLDIQPQDIGMTHIGHMGYFRKQAAPLWLNIAKHLDQYLQDGNLSDNFKTTFADHFITPAQP